jgi:hypothetical protein
MSAESDLTKLISEMRPELLPGRYVFVDLSGLPVEEIEILASVREAEGLSGVISQEDADRIGAEYGFVAAWITLRVHSALEAVGLTAAVSGRLAEEQISCNVIASLHHDHLLVPAEDGDRALNSLWALADGA